MNESLGNPSLQRQSWGAMLSIVVIVLMIVIGALYAYGKRISENSRLQSGAQTVTQP